MSTLDTKTKLSMVLLVALWFARAGNTLTLYKSGNDYTSGIEGVQPKAWADKKWEVALEEVYRNGTLVRDMTFDEVRANARK